MVCTLNTFRTLPPPPSQSIWKSYSYDETTIPTAMFQSRQSVASVAARKRPPVAGRGAVPGWNNRSRAGTAPSFRRKRSWSGATARSGCRESCTRARSWRSRRGGICRSGRSWRSGTARSGTGWSGATESDWGEYLNLCVMS